MAFLTAFVKLVLGMTPSCQLSKLVCFFCQASLPANHSLENMRCKFTQLCHVISSLNFE